MTTGVADPPSRAGPPAVVQVLIEAGRGGLETMSVDLALALAVRGLRSIVIGLDAEGEQQDRLRAGGVQVVSLGGRRLMDPRYHLQVARALRVSRAAAVHTHMFAPLLFSTAARRFAGIPRLVHTEHSVEYLLASRRYSRALKFLAMSTDCFVVLGERMRIFYEDLGVAPWKIRVIPNGVAIASVKVGAREEARRALGLCAGSVVGTVGRLAPEKNLGLLIRAFARATPTDSEATLVIIGDGTERASLEDLARHLGIADRVRFAGWRRDVARLLPAFDAFALSSESEGLPLALLEAMSAGVPVVSTRVGDIPDVVQDRETGRLVPPGDEGAMANAVADLLRDPTRRAAMASAARDLVIRRYSRDAMVDAYLDAYGLSAQWAATP